MKKIVEVWGARGNHCKPAKATQSIVKDQLKTLVFRLLNTK